LSKRFAGANNPTKIIPITNQKVGLGKTSSTTDIGHLPSPDCLVEKGIFTKEEFLEMVRVVDREIKRKRE
jgi:hypothetical protein